jgi:hypothetical protein
VAFIRRGRQIERGRLFFNPRQNFRNLIKVEQIYYAIKCKNRELTTSRIATWARRTAIPIKLFLITHFAIKNNQEVKVKTRFLQFFDFHGVY